MEILQSNHQEGDIAENAIFDERYYPGLKQDIGIPNYRTIPKPNNITTTPSSLSPDNQEHNHIPDLGGLDTLNHPVVIPHPQPPPQPLLPPQPPLPPLPLLPPAPPQPHAHVPHLDLARYPP